MEFLGVGMELHSVQMGLRGAEAGALRVPGGPTVMLTDIAFSSLGV